MKEIHHLLHYTADINTCSWRSRTLLSLNGPTSYDRFMDHYRDKYKQIGSVKSAINGPYGYGLLRLHIKYLVEANDLREWKPIYFKMDDAMEEEFLKEYEALPPRIKNVLSEYTDKNLCSFYRRVIGDKLLEERVRMPGLGDMSYKQMHELVQKVEAIVEKGPADPDTARLVNLTRTPYEEIKFHPLTHSFLNDSMRTLSAKTRKELASLKADEPVEFSFEFMLMPEDYRAMRYGYMDKEMKTEIAWLRDELVSHLRSLSLCTGHAGLFRALQEALETKTFSEEELKLLDQYLLFYDDSEPAPLDANGKKTGPPFVIIATSKKKWLVDCMKELIRGIWVSTPGIEEKYRDWFNGTAIKEFAKRINEEEGTRFSEGFVKWVMKVVKKEVASDVMIKMN